MRKIMYKKGDIVNIYQTMKFNDWRDDYVICEHVAENPDNGTQHVRFRVCCVSCMYDKGFMSDSAEFEYNHKYDNVATVKNSLGVY